MLRVFILSLLLTASVNAASPRHVVIEGPTPYDRGLAHGRILKDDIHVLVDRWAKDIHENFGVSADEFAARFVKQSQYVDAIRRWTPELLDEIRGIADGAGMPFDTMLVYQFGDEMWTEGEDVAKHCTSVGIDRRGKTPAYVAQNMDIEQFYGGFVVIAEIRGDGPDQMVLTYGGHLGLNGLNAAGLGLACNTIEHLSGSRDGLPQAFVVRGLLARSSFADAEKFLRTIRHASGQNYILGDRDHTISFEASANKVVAVTPQVAGCVYHTNYPLANDDQREKYRNGEKPMHEGRGRYEAADRRLRKRQTLDAIKDTLRSRDGIRSAVSNDATFASTIMILRSPMPELLVAPGRPDRNDYRRFVFTRR